MTTITEFLFPAPAARRSTAILQWWESRRLAYNLIVGSAGLVSIATFIVITGLPPRGHGFPPIWEPVVIFGLLANVCYSFGPATELGIQALWGRKVLPVGPTLFRMGLTFSVGLALLPTLIAGIDWVARILRFLL